MSWAHDHFGTDSLQVLELAEALDEPPVVIYWGFDASLTDEAVSAHPELAKYVQRLSEVFVTAAAIVAVSRFIAAELVRQVPEAKLRVHHIGVPLGPAPSLEKREPVVLFVGRHVEKKGLGDLIEALGRVRSSVPTARRRRRSAAPRPRGVRPATRARRAVPGLAGGRTTSSSGCAG